MTKSGDFHHVIFVFFTDTTHGGSLVAFENNLVSLGMRTVFLGLSIKTTGLSLDNKPTWLGLGKTHHGLS